MNQANIQEPNKIFFGPGDVVSLRQRDKMHCPAMLVIRKEQALFKDEMKGLRCRWFTDSGLMQEAVFNTKDLVLINSNGEIGR